MGAGPTICAVTTSARAPVRANCAAYRSLPPSTAGAAIRHYALVPMESFPELHDLIWLFESDPSVEHEDLGYPISETTFTTQRGGWTVEVMIAPYMYTAELRLRQHGSDAVNLRMVEVVASVAVDRTHGSEALIVSFDRNSRLNALRLQLKPTVVVTFDTTPPWAQ
ncbi:MAG: hypothetical protein M3P85_14045 [Actinomycetota bacterium]|nr:hypothetical protein [Actinomycetota bacterium]